MQNMKSYKDLEIYKLASLMSVQVHRKTYSLPKHEMYELGSQLRRSVHSIRANIVEGYGRRQYKQDFIRYLVWAHASLLESQSHIETLDRLYPDNHWSSLLTPMQSLRIKLHNFIIYVKNNWKT